MALYVYTNRIFFIMFKAARFQYFESGSRPLAAHIRKPLRGIASGSWPSAARFKYFHFISILAGCAGVDARRGLRPRVDSRPSAAHSTYFFIMISRPSAAHSTYFFIMAAFGRKFSTVSFVVYLFYNGGLRPHISTVSALCGVDCGSRPSAALF